MRSTIPVLDFERSEPGRRVILHVPDVVAAVDESDSFVEMPVRVVSTPADGLCVEVGPYVFTVRDVRRITAAVAAVSYDPEATS